MPQRPCGSLSQWPVRRLALCRVSALGPGMAFRMASRCVAESGSSSSWGRSQSSAGPSRSPQRRSVSGSWSFQHSTMAPRSTGQKGTWQRAQSASRAEPCAPRGSSEHPAAVAEWWHRCPRGFPSMADGPESPCQGLATQAPLLQGRTQARRVHSLSPPCTPRLQGAHTHREAGLIRGL